MSQVFCGDCRHHTGCPREYNDGFERPEECLAPANTTYRETSFGRTPSHGDPYELNKDKDCTAFRKKRFFHFLFRALALALLLTSFSACSGWGDYDYCDFPGDQCTAWVGNFGQPGSDEGFARGSCFLEAGSSSEMRCVLHCIDGGCMFEGEGGRQGGSPVFHGTQCYCEW